MQAEAEEVSEKALAPKGQFLQGCSWAYIE